MAPFRPHVASASPVKEVLFWAEDREAIPMAGQVHRVMRAEEASSAPGEQLGLAHICCARASAHLIPQSGTSVSIEATPKLPISSPL